MAGNTGCNIAADIDPSLTTELATAEQQMRKVFPEQMNIQTLQMKPLRKQTDTLRPWMMKGKTFAVCYLDTPETSETEIHHSGAAAVLVTVV